MNLRKLDLEEFFQEGNGGYTAYESAYPEGLGASILITPKKMIEVYNKPALDKTRVLVPGLGSHGDTLEIILAAIFNLELQGSYLKKQRILNDAIEGGVFNYIFVRLVNQIDNPYITVECPCCINSKEYDCLKNLNARIKALSFRIIPMVTIYNYDPTNGDFEPGDKKELYSGISLDEALAYFADKYVPSDEYFIKTAKYPERDFTYLEEEQEETRSL